jgi:phosphoenolpyruvate carboxykinase (ATP)
MYDLFLKTAREIYEEAKKQNRLHYNPDYDTLKKWFSEEPDIRKTRYGSLEVDTEPTSRLARFTKNNIDDKFGPDEEAFLVKAKQILSKEELIAFDVIVGDGSEKISARMVVPKKHAHVCYGGTKLFKPGAVSDPTYWILFFVDEEFEKNKTRKQPDKKVMLRNAYSPEGKMVKFVNNSNYIGEWKKGIFAGEDYRVKLKNDAIFLHAGCRMDYLENVHGDFKTTSSLFAALSANGKTSLTCKVLAKKGKEKSWLIQDDGGTLRKDGSFRGFEGGGVFVKTERLNPSDQIETYYGALRPNTYLENLYVEADGEIDFYNIERTSNGRAVIERRDFMHSSSDINVEKVDNLFLITRGSIIPAVCKLSAEQAAAFMILGQSMESSAGDPTRAGQLKNEFFYDPFIAGDKSAHANLFYEILKANPHIKCYLINTGGVGEGENYHDISLKDTMGILDSLVRGGLEDWEESIGTGLMVPRAVRTVDDILMHPRKLYSAGEFEERQKALDTHRAQYLEQFKGLDKRVASVF